MAVVIATSELEVQVSFKDGTLAVQLFSLRDLTTYAGKFQRTHLPTLNGHLADFAAYLTSIAHTPRTNHLLEFREPVLLIRDSRDGRQVATELTLRPLPVAERRERLRKRLAREKLAIRGMMERWTREEQTLAEQRRVARLLRREMKDYAAEQASSRREMEAVGARMQEVRREVREWREDLARVNQQLEKMANDQGNLVAYQLPQLKLPFVVSQDNPFAHSFLRTGNLLRSAVEPCLLYAQLVSAKPMPAFGDWTFSFKVITCRNGLAVGLTAEQNLLKQSSFSEDAAVSLCTRNGSFYVCGCRRGGQRASVGAGDTVKLRTDRTTGIVGFHSNKQHLGDLDLPPSLRQQRLYPFVELSRGDAIELE